MAEFSGPKNSRDSGCCSRLICLSSHGELTTDAVGLVGSSVVVDREPCLLAVGSSHVADECSSL